VKERLLQTSASTGETTQRLPASREALYVSKKPLLETRERPLRLHEPLCLDIGRQSLDTKPTLVNKETLSLNSKRLSQG
jgi:hypothetical protein